MQTAGRESELPGVFVRTAPGWQPWLSRVVMNGFGSILLLHFSAARNPDVGSTETDVEADKDGRGGVRHTHLFRAITDRHASRSIETAGHVNVATLAITKLLLKCEELRSAQASNTLRRGASPWTGSPVARRFGARSDEGIPRGTVGSHREG